MSQRLTPLAWVLFSLTGCLLLMAMNYQNNIAYLLCSAIFAAGVFAVIEARRNLRGIGLSIAETEAGFAGQLPDVGAVLSAPDDRPRLLLQLRLPEAPTTHQLVLDRRQALRLPAPPLQRGVHQLRHCHLESDYPFGLVRTWRALPITCDLIVYPAPTGERPLPGGGGDEHGRRRGDGDFAGHGRYSGGEPPGRIDWKVLAKDGPLLVKRFVTGSGRREHLLQLASLAGLGREAALSQLCRWICMAEERHEAYALRLDQAPSTDCQLGDEHRRSCLEALARA